jgi:HK97 family phage major capsid protein
MSDPINVLAVFDEFKKTHNEMLASKADGKALGELETKLAKIQSDLDKAEAENQKRVNEIKLAMQHTHLNGGDTGDKEKTETKAKFREFMRKGDGKSGHATLDIYESKALSVNDDTSGGYMVHADLSGRIIKRVFETSPIRAWASIQTISTDALEGMLDANQADFGWVAEAAVRPVTGTPKIGMWRIPTHEMYANPPVTQKLLDDAAWDAEAWLSEKVADRFARGENNAFVLGDGITKPRGFLTYDGVADDASIDFVSGTSVGFIKTGVNDAFPAVPTTGAPTAQGNPIIDLVYALKSVYRETPGTAFAMHRTTFAAVRKLQDALGNYIWQPGLAGQPSTLMGYPVAEFNDMPQLGASNKYAIAFANWKAAYQIVDRVGVRILRDPFTSKPHILFYTTKRTGGDLLNKEAIKLLKFAA